MGNNKLHLSDKLQTVMVTATNYAMACNHEFITPEHLLWGLAKCEEFLYAMSDCGRFDETTFLNDLDDAISRTGGSGNSDKKFSAPIPSSQFESVMSYALSTAIDSNKNEVEIHMLVNAILHQKESWAAYVIRKHIEVDDLELLETLYNILKHPDDTDTELEDDFEDGIPDDFDFPIPDIDEPKRDKAQWKSFVTCINDHLHSHNPLIGREEEISRTIQVLCRKEKNNPLHLGEPGVGKTALVFGVAARIESGDVPERLKGFRIYQLDMGTLLAGSQFRGDMEKRLKLIMDGVIQEGNAILYIDEIHNIVGAGASGGNANDVSNLMKPFLDGGDVRVIGATTYEEYNRQLAGRKGMIRRFQTIDVKEPSPEETLHILKSIKHVYEKYHHVKYPDPTLEYAVEVSRKFITQRFLPDKAIDLIDEAGAQAELEQKKYKKISKKDIANVLAKVTHINALAIRQNDNKNLANLERNIKAVIYGQDRAVQTVVEAVQLAKAGLNDENKPLASLLFVGPTGVGKTEVAKTLALELGVKLVRFDMSEYVEKHTVAKLIGAPAGYVGYDEGGLLTDAVLNSPDCVLLLDEIEKAHADIFNILLQVMDYGVLTDNKGRKAFFKNVVLIMTSNAGAQFAEQARLGFASTATAGGAMLKQVKNTFKPEFINRLNEIVVFNDMDQNMAELILNKKLRELQAKLQAKEVTISLSKAAHQHLLREGFSKQYGAREMDRVIQQQLKTMLSREILFGRLKKGGKATIDLENEHLTIIS